MSLAKTNKLQLAVIVCIVFAACGDDGGGVVVDAGIDAPVADAGPCGDELFYQVEVFDWSTDISVPNSEIPGPTVTATVVGNETNTTPVAPNGRAVLCLSRGTTHTILFESTVHLPHLEIVDPDAYEDYLASEQAIAYRVYVLKQADVDALTDGVGAAQNGHVLVNVQGDDAGFTVAIDASSDPGLVGSPTGTFASGTTTSATDTWVVFRNALVGTGETVLTLTGGIGCAAPTTIALAAGHTTGALAHCVVGP